MPSCVTSKISHISLVELHCQAEIKDGLYHMHADRKDSLVNSVHNEVVFKTAKKIDIWHVGWAMLQIRF